MTSQIQPRSTGVPRPFWIAVFWAWAGLGIFELLLPLYGRALGADSTTIGWLFGVFSFTALLLRLLIGRVLDHAPRRPIFVLGLLLYVLALSLFAVAQTVSMVVVARLLQGLGSTTAWLTAAVLLADWAQADQQARLFGRYQMISVLGSVIGAVWAGALMILLDGETRAALLDALRLLEGSIVGDLQGALVAALPPPWSPLAVLHLIFAGNALFAAIGWLAALRMPEPQRHHAATQMPRTLVRERLPLLTIALLVGLAGGLTLPMQVLLMDDRFALGGAGVALVYAVPGVVYGVAPEPLGRLADRWGYRPAALCGLVCLALASALLPIMPNVPVAMLVLCLEALGASIVSPALLALVAAGSAHARGSAYGLFTMASLLGTAVASPVGGRLYAYLPGLPFWLAAVCLVVAMLVVGRLRGTGS
ncbi:MAG TPA: MFS transporter [Herpetosiphonaceae bacterium]